MCEVFKLCQFIKDPEDFPPYLKDKLRAAKNLSLLWPLMRNLLALNNVLLAISCSLCLDMRHINTLGVNWTRFGYRILSSFINDVKQFHGLFVGEQRELHG